LCLFLLFIETMSEEKKVIAIDAMGGDKGPNAVLGGMNQYLYQNGEGHVFFRLFGDEKKLRKLLAKYPRVSRNVEVIHAPNVIRPTDKVMDVLRHAQDTSMYMAIKDVREGKSSAVISAGNTGILMSLSKLALKTVDGISRPAITTMLPSGAGDSRVVVLDLGANVQCDETILFDFAVLGSVYAEVVGKMPKPKLGVLNIGSEETKGNETLVHLNKILTQNKDRLPYDYIGFVEGTDISAGRVQVVVTDGFTGNIVLKTVEGTAKLVKRVVVENFKKSVLAIIGAFFLVHVFKRLKHKIDPRSYAGATFLGLRGFSVKTHGNSDALAFANSIKFTADLTHANLNGLIEERARALSDIRAQIKNEE